ncbi:MAG: ATP-binding cassette domain-containing protein [Succinivibrio sp.]
MGIVLDKKSSLFLGRLKKTASPYLWILSCLFILQAIAVFFFYSYIVKALYPLVMAADTGSLYLLSGAFVSAILRFILDIAQSITGVKLEKRISYEITQKISSRLCAVTPAYSDHHRLRPSVLTDATSDIVPYFTQYLTRLRLASFYSVMMLMLIATVSIKYALIIPVLIPLLPFFMILTGTATRKVARRQFVSMSRLSLKFSEVLSNLAFIHLFNLENAEHRRLKKAQIHFASKTMQILKIAFISVLALEFVATCSIALCGITLGFDVYDNGFGYDKALLILFLCPELFAPLRSLGAGFHIKQKALGVTDEIEPLLYGDDSSDNYKNNSSHSTKLSGSIKFSNVTAVYPNGQTAYEDLSFLAKENSLTLLKAPSASGKTSVLYTLCRWCSIKEGSVLIGSRSIESLCEHDIFESVALMPQFPEFFRTSIRNNLLLQSEDRMSELLNLLERTGMNKIINRLPGGLDYVYDPEKDCFSGGEKRLLSLVRTLVQDRRIYLLDEPTAGLSEKMARIVADIIISLKKSHTIIVATHSSMFDEGADLSVVPGGAVESL